ncbi:MAG: hypothetical protein WBA74_24715 [Cyclobacteriaceae bacterium]
MKRNIKKWSIRILVTGLLSVVLLVLAILNPQVLYANKTVKDQFEIYHDKALHPQFAERLAIAGDLIKDSGLYDEELIIKVCLNDGSFYPKLIETIRGRAFGWGMYRIAAFRGEFEAEANTITIGSFSWNMEQLIAHELVHCLQLNHFGLLNSNPIADHPTWKWEGYAEYISRQSPSQQDLVDNITRYKTSVKANPDAWEVSFPDGTIAPVSYYEYWLLVQYCLDIKKIDYLSLMEGDYDRDTVLQEMEDWYQKEKEGRL